MRVLAIVGGVLVVLGTVLLLRGGSFSTRREVLRVGDVKVTASESRTIPPWASALTIAAGLVLVVAGMRGRKS